MKTPKSRRLAIDKRPVNALAFCPRRQLLAIAQSDDETRAHPSLSLWSTETWKKVDSVERKHGVFAACFTSNSSHLIYATGQELVLYDLEQLDKHHVETDNKGISSIKASSSSSRVVVSGAYAEVWDVSTCERLWRLESLPRHRPAAVELRHDDAVLIAGHDTREGVDEIELATGTRSTMFTPGIGAATCSTIGCNDQVYGLVSRVPEANYLWDIATRERVCPQVFNERLGGSTSMCLHPTKRQVATGSYVGFVSLQDLDREGEFLWSEQIHGMMVSTVVVAGEVVVSGCHDGEVWITDVLGA